MRVCHPAITFFLHAYASGLSLSGIELDKRGPPPDTDFGSDPLTFNISTPNAVNGSLTVISNCNHANCTLDVPTLPPKTVKVKRIDTTYNVGLRDPDMRADYIRLDNRWLARAENERFGGQYLEVYEFPLNQQPHVILDHPAPLDPVSTWQVDYIMPPWVIREFADIHRGDGTVAREADLANLGDMFRQGGTVEVDPSLHGHLNRPNNWVGADARVLNFRERAMSAPTIRFWEQFWRNLHATDDHLQALGDLEMDLEGRWESVRNRIARRLNLMYPQSPNIGRRFSDYADSLQEIYEDATRIPHPGFLDPRPEDESTQTHESWQTLDEADSDEVTRRLFFFLPGSGA